MMESLSGGRRLLDWTERRRFSNEPHLNLLAGPFLPASGRGLRRVKPTGA